MYINKVVDLFYPDNTQRGYLNDWYERNNLNSSASIPGNPVGSFTGLEIEGIFQNEEDLTNHAGQGWVYRQDNVGIKIPYDIGAWKFRDVNNDDTILYADDKVILGSPHPDFMLGLPVAVNFRQFDLSLLFYGVFGHEIWNHIKLYTDFETGTWDSQKGKNVLHSWGLPGVDNQKAKLPKLTLSTSLPSSYYIEDGSFIRLRQVSLGYSFNTKSWKGIKKLRIYIQGMNVLTLTDYTGMDPMVTVNTDNDLEMGVDYTQYPTSPSWLVGINMIF